MPDKLKKMGDVHVFMCPGCKYLHQIDSRWGFNGSLEKPTFTPSLLLRELKGPPGARDQVRCHSFIKEGKIQFLNDCGHDLKGKTVEIPNWDDEMF